MTATREFLRGLVRAAVLGALAPIVLLLAGGALGGRTVIWMLLAVSAAVFLARATSTARGGSPRRLLLDVLLVAGGLGFAACLAAPGLAGAALALWGFGLVLSLRAVLSGSAHAADAPAGDPFEQAHARALALLEEEP